MVQSIKKGDQRVFQLLINQMRPSSERSWSVNGGAHKRFSKDDEDCEVDGSSQTNLDLIRKNWSPVNSSFSSHAGRDQIFLLPSSPLSKSQNDQLCGAASVSLPQIFIQLCIKILHTVTFFLIHMKVISAIKAETGGSFYFKMGILAHFFKSLTFVYF